MKKITRCEKNAPLKMLVGAFLIIEAGAVVYNVSSGSFLPNFAVDPVKAITTAAPAALTVGTMLATWSYISCKKSKYW